MTDGIREFITSPDLSFTITAEALHKLNHSLVYHPLGDSAPEQLWLAHIFAMLTMFEGYDDQTVRRLARNLTYRHAIEIIYKTYLQWKAENNA